MTVGLQRATIFAIKEESNAGDYEKPVSGSEFVPLRPGNTLNFSAESLDSDELLNDIGAAKSFTGKESTEGSHSAYLKNSGTAGVEPELGVMYESVLGDKTVNSVEYSTSAGSTESVFVVANGSNFYPGQALLVKDPSGYYIRNIKSINSNNLTMNFVSDSSPAASINLGKSVTYKPAAQGHPTFSATKYVGNGHAIEATAGNTVTELSVTADANGFGEVEFSYQGTKYLFNPIEVDSSNTFIDFLDENGTYQAEISPKIYKTPIELADAIQLAMLAVVNNGATVSYNNSNGKFSFKSPSSTTFEILWDTGVNAANNIANYVGFDAVDSTGALEYSSSDAISLGSSLTPSYDNVDAIIIKGAELFIGNALDNLCVCAQTVSLTISKEVQDVDCICEETGVKEKIPTGRTVEMSVTAVLNKYDASLLDALLKNSGISAMLNAGPKTSGSWVPGKCFNAYLQNCTVSSYTTTGDSFIQAEITLKGFVTSTSKDVYINFV